MRDKLHELVLPTRVVFQAGALARTAAECHKIRLSRPYVITDRRLRELGHVGRLEDALRGEDVTPGGVFDDVPAGGDLATVARATEEMARTAADGIIALGGGSVIDTAKAVNILLVKGGSLVDHQGPGALDDAPFVPFVCLPTTAGTGSEVSMAATIRDRPNRKRIFFRTPRLAAGVAILDPELTVSMPPALTAEAGFEALSHAVESVLATNAQPATDGLAVSAIRSIAASLPRAVSVGSDLDARGGLLLASNIAGISHANAGVGVVHACANALGTLSGLSHGLACALMLPHGVRFNLTAAGEDRKDLLGWAFGTDDIPGRIAGLLAECGLPSRLREAGITEQDLAALSAAAETDPAMALNPREAERKDLLELFRTAF